MRAMSAIGLTAMALGNHEFDKGVVNFAQQYNAFGRFPIMAVELRRLRPIPIKIPRSPTLAEIGRAGSSVHHGQRRRLEDRHHRSRQPLVDRRHHRRRQLARHHVPIESTARRSPKQRRRCARNVDIVIVASHLGLDEDEDVVGGRGRGAGDQNARASRCKASTSSSAAICTSSSTRPKICRTSTLTDEHVTGHTVLCHSGAFAKYVGRLDLVVHVADPAVAGDTTATSSRYTYRIIPITDSIPSDPDMDQHARAVSAGDERGAQPDAGLRRHSLLDAQRRQLSQDHAQLDPDGGDSQLGNMVAHVDAHPPATWPPTTPSPTRSASAPTSSRAHSTWKKCTTCSRSITRSPRSICRATRFSRCSTASRRDRPTSAAAARRRRWRASTFDMVCATRTRATSTQHAARRRWTGVRQEHLYRRQRDAAK